MKRLLLLSAVLFGAAISHAQGHYIGVVQDNLGRGVAGATIRVCTEVAVGSPCTPLPPNIYTCVALDSTCIGTNPLSSDQYGNFDFYAQQGVPYHLQISGSSVQPYDLSYVFLPSLVVASPALPFFSTQINNSGGFGSVGPCTNGQLQIGQTSVAPLCTSISGDSNLNAAGVMTNTGLNGVSLAGLATGPLGNTTGTGVPFVYSLSGTGTTLPTTNNPTFTGTISGVNMALSGALVAASVSSGLYNNVVEADAQSGADACAKISAAVALLDATQGGTVDARGLTTAQLSSTCATSVATDRPVTILLPTGVLKHSGRFITNTNHVCPSLIGAGGWDYTFPPTGYGSVVQSMGTGFAISDLAPGGCSGSVIRDVDFNGNSLGTMGWFGPMTNGVDWKNFRFRSFTQTGSILGGLWNYLNSPDFSSNGGDGLLYGGDSVIEGKSGIYGNGGTGIQIFAGGTRLTNPNVADNGLHNVWFAGGALATSRPNLNQIIQPYIIRPSSGNAGNYYFYYANVGGTTAAAPPVWCQTLGCQVTDGTEIAYNVGTLGGITIPSAGIIWLTDGYIGDAGAATVSTYPSFKAFNVLVDGQLSTFPYCDNGHIIGLHVQQGFFEQANTAALGINNCENFEVSGGTLSGESYNSTVTTPDRGGLILSGVSTSTFSNLDFELIATSALQITNGSFGNQFTNVHITNDVANSTVSPYTYGLYLDNTVYSNSIMNLQIIGRSADAKGIFGGSGGANFVYNYSSSGTNSGSLSFDTLTDIVMVGAFNRDGTFPWEIDIGATRAVLIDNGGGVTFANSVQIDKNLVHAGSSSGSVTEQTQAATGTWNWNWPITAGSANCPLLSQGGAGTAMTWASGFTGSATSTHGGGTCVLTIVCGIITAATGC